MIAVKMPTSKLLNRFNRYTLEEVIGSGGFGYIYIATIQGTKRKAVMKVKPQYNIPSLSEMHFYHQAGKSDQLQSLTKFNKRKYLGIPEMYWFGIHLVISEDTII